MSSTNIVHSPLKATKFSVRIAGSEYANLAGSVTEYNHPGVSCEPVVQTCPKVDIPHPGSKLVYEPLTIRHQLDSGMTLYDAVHDWIIYNATNEDDKLRDITLTLYNANNAPTKNVNFYNAFPEAISQLTFSASDPNDTQVSVDLTFRYTHFETKAI